MYGLQGMNGTEKLYWGEIMKWTINWLCWGRQLMMIDIVFTSFLYEKTNWKETSLSRIAREVFIKMEVTDACSYFRI